MGKSISLFSGYNQKENRTTNYCLLMLKMLYEENPKYLSEVLENLIGDKMDDVVGVNFTQQQVKGSGVPDGLIWQKAFTVYIETKNFDWFHKGQLESHLKALDKEATGKKILFALSNFESTETEMFSQITQLCNGKYKNSLCFRAISFERFLGAIRELKQLPKNLTDAVLEFKTYLDEQGLLSSWQQWLDVVNCAGNHEWVTQHRIYACPSTGSAYTHGRCKYFGMYRNKSVELIAEIEAIVEIDRDDTTRLQWSNVDGKAQDVVKEAVSRFSAIRPEADWDARVFVLGQAFPTDFKKDSSGGMFGSKIYFNIGRFQVADAKELADKLRNLGWSTVERE